MNNLPPGSVVGIVGAGLSGVELASELSESRGISKLNYLIVGNILSAFPDRLSKYVEGWFNEHKVEVINNANITKVEENTLYNHDIPLHCDVIVWTAGIQTNEIVREMEGEKDNLGKLSANATPPFAL